MVRGKGIGKKRKKKWKPQLRVLVTILQKGSEKRAPKGDRVWGGRVGGEGGTGGEGQEKKKKKKANRGGSKIQHGGKPGCL